MRRGRDSGGSHSPPALPFHSRCSVALSWMLNIELFQRMNFRPIIIQRIVLVAHKTKLATHRFQVISTQEKKKKKKDKFEQS